MANTNNVTYDSIENLLDSVNQEFFTNKLLTKEISINQGGLLITDNGIIFSNISKGEQLNRWTVANDFITSLNDGIGLNGIEKLLQITRTLNNTQITKYYYSSSAPFKTKDISDYIPKQNEAGFSAFIFKIKRESTNTITKNAIKIGEQTLTNKTIEKANGINYMTESDLDDLFPTS